MKCLRCGSVMRRGRGYSFCSVCAAPELLGVEP